MIKGVFWPSAVSYELLLRETAVTALSTLVGRRSWQWIGHIMRMATNSFDVDSTGGGGGREAWDDLIQMWRT